MREGGVCSFAEIFSHEAELLIAHCVGFLFHLLVFAYSLLLCLSVSLSVSVCVYLSLSLSSLSMYFSHDS